MSSSSSSSKRTRLHDPELEDRVKRAALVTGVAPKTVNRIRNILLPEKAVKPSPFQRDMQCHQQPAAACFDRIPVPAIDEGDAVELVAANLPKLLQFACSHSPEYFRVLVKAAEAGGGKLQPVIYSDEAQGGNILAVEKTKKAVLFYWSVAELRSSFHLENAWLPVSLFQHFELDRVDGGLSAVSARLLRHLHEASQDVLSITVGSRCLQLELQQRYFYLGDLDAQRATYGITGSSGTKNCMFCSNVLRRNTGVSNPAFVEVSEWDSSKFVPVSDQEYSDLAAELRSLTRVSHIAKFEQTSGLKRLVHGVLFDEIAKRILPPSMALNDVTHVYCTNGIVSWELGLLYTSLRTHFPNFSMSMLGESAVTEGFTGPGASGHTSAAYIRRMFHEDLFDPDYKANAERQWSIVPLVRYYLHTTFAEKRVAVEEIRSFDALADVMAELRRLRYSKERIVNCSHLEGLQQSHQRLHNAAHGLNAAKPKHHQARHLPSQALKLGYLPDCAVHESKHKVYKNGLTERYTGLLREPIEFSHRVLAQLLLTVVSEINEKKLDHWGIEKPPRSQAAEWLRQALRCPDLETGKEVVLWNSRVSVGDVLLTSTDTAGVVAQCLSSSSQRRAFALLRPLRMVERCCYGTRWSRATQLEQVYEFCESKPYHMPQWWKLEEHSVLCLH